MPVRAIESPSAQAQTEQNTVPASPKDLFYKQTLGLQYSIELIRGNESYVVDSRFPFRSGDQIRFRVRPNINGYMYIVMSQGSSGASATLFPDTNYSDNNSVAEGYEYIVPSKGTLVFDKNAGLEHVQLVLSKQPFDPLSIDKRERSVKISPKAGESFIGNNCFIDTPAAMSTGHCTDKEQTVTMVTTDMSAPLTAELTLMHEAGARGARGSIPTLVPPSPTHEASAPAMSADVHTAWSSAPTEASPVLDKWALVVGISKFQHPGMNLLFAAKDAKDFADFLIQEQHFAADHVKLITDEQATRSHIESDVGDPGGWLPRNIRQGDLVVVYVATHGMVDKQTDRSYLIASDTDPTKPYSTAIELQNLVEKWKQQLSKVTNRIMVVLDTCHAGKAGQKAVFLHAKLDNIFQGTGQMMVASCQPEQVSFDSKRFNNGLFTKYLIEGLRKNSNVQAAFNEVSQSVVGESQAEFSKEQTPMLKDDEWKGGPLILSAPP
ncbi:MAG TPA: caspase family protein, partial [Candidatus Obscuribacterales bacterium]